MIYLALVGSRIGSVIWLLLRRHTRCTIKLVIITNCTRSLVHTPMDPFLSLRLIVGGGADDDVGGRNRRRKPIAYIHIYVHIYIIYHRSRYYLRLLTNLLNLVQDVIIITLASRRRIMIESICPTGSKNDMIIVYNNTSVTDARVNNTKIKPVIIQNNIFHPELYYGGIIQ